MVLAEPVQGNCHDAVLAFKEKGGPASTQASFLREQKN